MASVSGTVAYAAPPSSDTPATSSCRVPADTQELIPDGAEFMASVDLQRVSASPLFKQATTRLRSEPDVRRTLDALDACKLGIDDLDRITLAGTERDDFVLVLEGSGIGSAALMQCAAEKLAPGSPASTFAPAVAGCMSGLDLGDGVGFVLDKRHLVFVSDSWKSRVGDRLAGKGRSSAKGSMREPLAGANTHAPIWFAAQIDETVDSGMGQYQVSSVGGSIDLARGLHLETSAQLSTSSDAARLRQELESYRAMAVVMGPSMGIPADVIAGVQVTGQGRRLGMSVDLTQQQVAQLESALTAQLQGY